MTDDASTDALPTDFPVLAGHERARRSITSVLRDVWRRQQVTEVQRRLLRPRHLLLVGPTGSGKTTLLRHLLGASDQPHVRVSASGWLRSGDDLPSAESLVQAVTDAAASHGDREQGAPLGAAVLWIDDIQTLVVSDDDANASTARTMQRELVRLLDETAFQTTSGSVETDELLVVLSGTTSAGKPPELLPDLGARMVAQIMLEPLGDADLMTLLALETLPFCARYLALAAADGVTLSFEDEALEELAAIANELNTRHDDMGAHRLAGLLDRVVDGHLPTQTDGSDADTADETDETNEADETDETGAEAAPDVADEGDSVADSDEVATTVVITAAMVEERLADLLEDDDMDGAIL